MLSGEESWWCGVFKSKWHLHSDATSILTLSLPLFLGKKKHGCSLFSGNKMDVSYERSREMVLKVCVFKGGGVVYWCVEVVYWCLEVV